MLADRILRITDPADERLRDYVRLTDLALRTRSEAAEGLFVGEGELVIGRALAAGYEPRSFLLAENRVSLLDDELAAELEASAAPVYVGAHDVLEQVTGYHVHRGSLASFHRKPLPSLEAVLADARRVLVLEEVNNHTNVGAVVRNAAALGVDALLLDPRSADPLYRRAVRVSMGSVFSLPWTRLLDWPADLERVKDRGFRLLAFTPSPQATPLDGIDPSGRLALLFGAEGPGLTKAALDHADEHVVIPMANGIDSLNIAAAATLGCWELRPRR